MIPLSLSLSRVCVDTQLATSMRLDEHLLNSLAVAVHGRLEPSASERLLERPAVTRAKLLLAGRWAIHEWRDVRVAGDRTQDHT